MSGKLARVQWQLGQTLLPQHFEAQEASVLADSFIKFSQLGNPFYGVMQLSFDQSALVDDIVRVDCFSCILKSGETIVIGGNAAFIRNEVVLPSESLNVSLFVDIYQPQVTDLKHDTTTSQCSEAQLVDKKYYQIDLVSLPSAQDSKSGEIDGILLERFKLVVFIKTEDKNWLIDQTYLPPMVIVDKSPLFERRIDKINGVLNSFRLELKQYFQSDNTTQAGQLKPGLHNLLGQLYSCQRMLEQIKAVDSEIVTHPFELFSQLQKLYVDCKLYHYSLPENFGITYRHKALAEVFDRLIELLEQVILLKEYDYQWLGLIETNGIYATRLEVNKDDQKRSYYLAISAEDQGVLKHLTPPERITSIERVAGLYQNLCDGVELVAVDDDSMTERVSQLGNFTYSAKYYRIVERGEWKNVVADKSFGFYGQSSYRGFHFHLIIETQHYAARG
ncbi:MAG: type VI secretion system baseplate subunit TssK [Candidatus Sedimenticola sp. (ex Thyasira tokunagai)]